VPPVALDPVIGIGRELCSDSTTGMSGVALTTLQITSPSAIDAGLSLTIPAGGYGCSGSIQTTCILQAEDGDIAIRGNVQVSLGDGIATFDSLDATGVIELLG